MATRRVHKTIQGHELRYDESSPELERFLRRVEEAAQDDRVSEAELVALVYSNDNPLLERSPVGGVPVVTQELVDHPVYPILIDLLDRKRVKERGIDVSPRALPLEFRAGEEAGVSFHLRYDGEVEVTRHGEHIVEGTIPRWKRIAIITSRGNEQTLFEITPSDEENTVALGSLYVRGRFAIARRESDGRKAQEAWEVFEAE